MVLRVYGRGRPLPKSDKFYEAETGSGDRFLGVGESIEPPGEKLSRK